MPCQIHSVVGVLQRKFIVSQIISSEMMLVSANGGSMLTECHRAMNHCQMDFVYMPPFFLWKLLNIFDMRSAHFHQNYRALVSKTTRNSQKKSYNSIMTMKFSDIFTFSLFTIFLFNVTLSSGESSDSDETHGIHVASWNWDHVGVFITITAFIVFSGLAKVGRFYMFILFMLLWFKYYYY